VDPLLTDFDSFVRTRTPALLRSAYLLTGDQHLAEDLVQAALARTHRSWKQLHYSGNAEAYTRKTMYHLQVSWWRRRRVAESMPGELSMDGRYVSVGWKGTDPSRRDDSFAVVDTTIGKLVNLPVHGEIRSIHFTADRRVLVRQADRIVVLDSQFDVLGEVAEPRELRELTLLACVP
jgi:DNA-directed RNA polymerase specialized sigma24 family protein